MCLAGGKRVITSKKDIVDASLYGLRQKRKRCCKRPIADAPLARPGGMRKLCEEACE